MDFNSSRYVGLVAWLCSPKSPFITSIRVMRSFWCESEKKPPSQTAKRHLNTKLCHRLNNGAPTGGHRELGAPHSTCSKRVVGTVGCAARMCSGVGRIIVTSHPKKVGFLIR